MEQEGDVLSVTDALTPLQLLTGCSASICRTDMHRSAVINQAYSRCNSVQ